MDDSAIFPTGPLYVQIRQQILNGLKDGLYNSTDPLPSEQRLARLYGVSQGTVRKAIDELVAQNILFRHQGKGTFVRQHDERASLFRFFNFVRPDGTRPYPESRNLFVRIVVGRRDQCERLNEARGAKLIEIVRVRMIDNVPAILETILVSQSRFKNLEKHDLPNTLYKLYADEFDVNITRAEEQVSAVTLQTDQAEHLSLPSGSVGLRAERVAFGLNDLPVEHRVSLCRPDLLVYATRLN